MQGTECIQVHKVTGGAVVGASAQNVDGLGLDSSRSPIFPSGSLGRHVTSPTDINSPNCLLDHYIIWFSQKKKKKKNHHSKIWKNPDESYKIYQNFWAQLEDGDFEISLLKKKMDSILYIKINKKVSYKMDWRIDIQNVTMFFFKLIFTDY